jgi:hypothetical protein
MSQETVEVVRSGADSFTREAWTKASIPRPLALTLVRRWT